MKQQDGFTLIEVLVSFVILSGAIILSFESYTNGLRALHQTQEGLDAQTLAQSIMARTLADDPELTNGSKGTSGQMAWQLSMRPLSQESVSVLHPSVVEIHVFDYKGREMPFAVLSTIIIKKVTAR